VKKSESFVKVVSKLWRRRMKLPFTCVNHAVINWRVFLSLGKLLIWWLQQESRQRCSAPSAKKPLTRESARPRDGTFRLKTHSNTLEWNKSTHTTSSLRYVFLDSSPHPGFARKIASRRRGAIIGRLCTLKKTAQRRHKKVRKPSRIAKFLSHPRTFVSSLHILYLPNHDYSWHPLRTMWTCTVIASVPSHKCNNFNPCVPIIQRSLSVMCHKTKKKDATSKSLDACYA